MRKRFRGLFALFPLLFVLLITVSAANSEPSIQILQPNAQITFHDDTGGQFSAAYTDPAIQKHCQYLILLIESPFTGDLSETGHLLYIDQKEADADGSITFPNIYPSELRNSTLVLTGLDAPVVLAEITVPRVKTDVSDEINFSTTSAAVTYTGSPLPLSALVSPASLDGGSANITYLLNGQPATLDTSVTDAGAYAVTARYEDEARFGEKTVTAVIEKAVVPIPAAASDLVYNGQEQIGISENAYYKIENCRAVNAGHYTAVAILNDDRNYRWEDALFDGQISWSIAKAPARTIEETRVLRCDNSTPQKITAEDISVQLPDPCAVALSDVSFSDNSVLESVSSAANESITYALKPGLTAMDTDQNATIAVRFSSQNFEESLYKLTILVPKIADVSDQLSFSDLVSEKTYHAARQTLETAVYHDTPVGESTLTYQYSADPIDVGDYTVTAIYRDAASRGTAQAILRITPAELRVTASEGIRLSKTYDGTANAPAPEIRFVPAGTIHNWPQTAPTARDYTITAHYVDASGAKATDAGDGKSIQAVVNLKNTDTAKNYRLTDINLYFSGASIEPKPIIISLSDLTARTYSGEPFTPTPALNAAGLISGDTLLPGRDFTVSYADNLHAGTAAVRVRPVDGSNYTFAQAEGRFSIRKAPHENLTFRDTVFTDLAHKKQTKEVILSDVLSGLDGAKLGTPTIEAANRMAASATLNGETLMVDYTPRAKGTTSTLKIPVTSMDYETFYIDITLTAADIPPTSSGQTEITRVDGEKAAVSEPDLSPRVKNGVADLSLDEDEINDILTELFAAADAQKASVLRLSFDLKTGKSVDEVKLTLPRKAVRELSKQDADLQLVTDLGTVRWDAKALARLAKESAGDTMIFSLSMDEDHTYTVSISSGKILLDSFGGGNVYLTLPYETENEDSIFIYYADMDAWLNSFDYDARRETISFSYDAPGTFHIGEKAQEISQMVPHFAQFSDVPPDHWAAPYIYDLTGRGVLAGGGNGQFLPDEPVTREQFVQMLFAMAGSPPSYPSTQFADVPPDRWSAPAVSWAASRGIVSGKDITIFAPTDPITRQEIAAILQRYALSEGRQLPAVQPPEAFLDQDEISNWAVDAVAAMRQAGIISGAYDYFAPKAIATRAECAKMLSLLHAAME